MRGRGTTKSASGTPSAWREHRVMGLQEDRFEAQEYNAKSKAAVTRARQMQLVDGLCWLVVALGLLPGGKTGPQRNAASILVSSLTIIFCLSIGTLYLVFIHYVFLRNTSIMSFTMLIVAETIYAWCTSLSSYASAISIWINSRKLVTLFQEYKNLNIKELSIISQVIRIVFALTPNLFNFILYSFWYHTYLVRHTEQWTYFLFEISLLWLQAVLTVPMVFLASLGQIILDSLTANNATLAMLLEGKASGVTLLDVHHTNLRLRDLYGKLEKVVSIPILCYDVTALYTIINTFFLMVTFNLPTDAVYIPFIAVGDFLTLAIVTMTGHIADNIRRKAAEPMRLLAQTQEEAATWPQSPHKVVIYKLAEIPLTLSVGGCFNLSVSNILSMLSAACAYLVVFLQFSQEDLQTNDFAISFNTNSSHLSSS